MVNNLIMVNIMVNNLIMVNNHFNNLIMVNYLMLDWKGYKDQLDLQNY